MITELLFGKWLDDLNKRINRRVSVSIRELEIAKDKATESITTSNTIMLQSLNSVNEAKADLDTLYNKYNELLDQRKQEIDLQKLYVYLIPKLLDSSGITLPENFDITNYDDAQKLYKRFYNGDLSDY